MQTERILNNEYAMDVGLRGVRENDEWLLDVFQDSRVCSHFHMSIQSAQSEVLKEMKRKYTRHDVESALHKIADKGPNSYVGMDVISGFPTES